jgi:hypothetical protein
MTFPLSELAPSAPPTSLLMDRAAAVQGLSIFEVMRWIWHTL